MAEPYKEGACYSMRLRQDGHDVYVTGYRSKRQAREAAHTRLAELLQGRRPHGRGAAGTTLGEALQNYALERFPFLKSAAQEVRRINRYLLAARFETLKLVKLPITDSGAAYHEVTLVPFKEGRDVPCGLVKHRAALLDKSANSDKHRAVLAGKVMANISRNDVQSFMDTLRKEECKPATLQAERSVLRTVFNHAFDSWNWSELVDNPASRLKMPAVDNARDRVLSDEEQVRLNAALDECRNACTKPLITILVETGMRTSEPLDNATWGDVDWERCVLHLRTSKTGKRDVPLSPLAIAALRELGPGEPDEPIASVSYEAIRAAMNRACERAGIKDLHLHDLRHTAATRMAKETGNIFMVAALTGHKTLSMVQRYVNISADDIVEHLKARHAPASAPVAPPEPAKAPPAAPISMTPQQLQDILNQAVAAGLRHEASRMSAAHGMEASASMYAHDNVIQLRKTA